MNGWSSLFQTSFSYVNLVLIVIFAIYFAVKKWRKIPENYPPGSMGVPLLGNLPFLRGNPEWVFAEWIKQYGPVCYFKMGTLDTVLLGTAEVVHEAFVKNSDAFSGRVQNCVDALGGEYGIILQDNTFHLREQRRFGLTVLREFGMGRRSIEPRIIEKCSQLCEHIEERSDKNVPFEIDQLLYVTVSGVISQLSFNADIATENTRMKKQLDVLVHGGNEKSALVSLLLFAPFLRNLPLFSGVVRSSVDFRNDIEAEIRECVKEHRATRDPKDPRDVIDRFLNEMDNVSNGKRKSSSSVDMNGNVTERVEASTSFVDGQLISLLRDLFLAGTDTTSSTICWAILYLSDPELQRKLHEEIDRVLGQGTVPSMAKADLMPYSRAVLQETLRIRPVLPLGVPRCATKSGTIMGYHIPKGTMVIANIFHIHHDEKLWPDPERFDPERHIDGDGKFIKSPHIIPFSLGSRQCLGMQLANMELFLVLTSLYQRYSIKVVDPEKLDMKGKSHFTLRQPPFKVLAKRR